jgi:hypothetical protein
MTKALEVQRFDRTLRWMVKKLRLLLDAADERLHAAEVALRGEVKCHAPSENHVSGISENNASDLSASNVERASRLQSSQSMGSSMGFSAHGSHKAKPRRRHTTARDFDLRFAR